MHRRCPAWIRMLPVWTLVLAAVAGSVSAAAPPRPISTSLIGATELNESQIALITEWAEYYCAQMGRPDADPLEIEEARKQLARPFSIPGAQSESFRFEYSRIAIDRLRPIVQGTNLHAAVNALRVLEELGTKRALDLLLDHVNPRDEARWQIRLRAAFGCRSILSNAAVPPRQVAGVARRLLGAVRLEDRSLVLRRQLQAIAAAATANYPNDVKAQVREIWADALAAVVQTVAAEPGPTDLVGVIFAEGPAFRDAYISQVFGAERERLGAIIGPALGKVLEIASQHADDVHNHRQLRELYGKAILFCQEFLTFIDLTERPDQDPPSTPFGELWHGDWSNGDRQQFQEGVEQWRTILSRPPYRR